ncbi:hypothetical protein [Burkholderia gladioli]|uniref:hypothetical protein n=1 Tax=Burkholderia gladioli TaxID=28095 RepID=UPI0038B2426F
MKAKRAIGINAMIYRLLVGLMPLLLFSACSERSMNLDVAIYNYWPRAIYDVAVDGQYAGGAFMAYEPGNVGGKVVCCVRVKPGPISIEYSLGGPEGAARLGEKIRATAVLQNLPGNSKILTMHVYPSGTAYAEVSRAYVDERPEYRDKR